MEPVQPWPDVELAAAVPSLERGRRTLLLHLSRPSWVHRRVESIEFVSAASVRRRISSDFTISTTPPSGGSPLELVPLTLLAKGPLSGLDLVDEDGRALPVLTRNQSGVVAWEMLLAAGELEVGAPLPADVRRSLQRLVVAEAGAAVHQLAVFGRLEISADVRRRLLASPLMRHLMGELAGNFLLLTPVAFEAGRRRILKLSYVGPLESPSNDFAAQLGLRPNSFVFDLPTVGYSSSYHLEIQAPTGLAIVGGDVVAGTDREETVRRLQTVDRIHFHVAPEAQGSVAQAIVDLGIPRRGLLRAAAVTSWAGFVLLVVLALLAGRVDERTNGGVAALLLLVPTIAGAYLVRPGEHGLASSLLFWGRAAILSVSGTALAAATVVTLGVSSAALHLWLAALASAAAVPTLVLTLALARGVSDVVAPWRPRTPPPLSR